MKQTNLLLDLFLTFMKIGLFTFGGGYVMIPVIQNTCVEKKQWISHDDMMNVIVIAESTPGPTAVNCATYVGYQQAGLLGSLVTTVGVVLPSFLVIFLISNLLDNFLEITLIAKAFQGIKIAVGLLILNAALNMRKKMPKSCLGQIIAVCSFSVILLTNFFSWNFSSISLMLIAGAISLVASYAVRKDGTAR